MNRFNFILALAACLLGSCKNDKFRPRLPAPQPAPVTATVKNCGSLANVSYSAQVQPLLNTNCIRCHDASTGFKLDNYSNVLLFANSGQLSGCLTGDQSYLQMPPSTSLDSCSIKTIVNWVKQGKLNN